MVRDRNARHRSDRPSVGGLRRRIQLYRIAAPAANWVLKLTFLQPCGIEAVEAGEARIRIGQLAGQGAQVAIFADELAAAENLRRRDRHPPHAVLARKEIRSE